MGEHITDTYITETDTTYVEMSYVLAFLWYVTVIVYMKKIELKENINTNFKMVLPHGAQDQTVAWQSIQ